MALEVRRGQQRTQLVDVAASPVDPPPERDWLRHDARPRPVPEQRDDRHAPGARLIETCGLGGAGVDGWDRRRIGHVTERMRVADREIVQPTLDARIATNREVRLIAVDIESAPMDTSNPYSCVTRFAGGKGHRQVVLSRPRSARTGIEDYVRRKFILEVIAVNDMHPARKLRSKRVSRSPHRLGGKGIVIARNEKNG